MKPKANEPNTYAECLIQTSITEAMHIAIKSYTEKMVEELADPKEDPIHHETVLMMLQEDTSIMEGIMDSLVVKVSP
jgi:hypothetical protein